MNQPAFSERTPPQWLERLLLLLLKKRDRETISGDLLEEYREVILPERGPRRASLWYWKQVLGFVDSYRFGLALGVLLAGFNLAATLVAPLAEDTPLRVGIFLATLMLLWGWSGFIAERRTQRFLEAPKAGAIVAAISLGLFHLAAILRMNIFLDTVSQRSDWQELIMRFNQSGFESLRVYANYTYLRETGTILLVSALVGAVCGTFGGVVARAISRDRTRLSRSL